MFCFCCQTKVANEVNCHERNHPWSLLAGMRNQPSYDTALFVLKFLCFFYQLVLHKLMKKK